MSAHWSEAYIGLPFIEGDNDCASFCAKVQREVFGRDIALPHERADGVRGWSRQIEIHKADYAVRVDQPTEGDAVLMMGRGRLDHIGVYTVISGVEYVLHSMKNAGQVCLHRLRDLEKQGLIVEGFYQWL